MRFWVHQQTIASWNWHTYRDLIRGIGIDDYSSSILPALELSERRLSRRYGVKMQRFRAVDDPISDQFPGLIQ